MLRLDDPATSLRGFILFTVAQVVVFLFRPSLYADVAGDVDAAPFRVFRGIGAKECGLLCLYVAVARAGDRRLAWMTVAGRLQTIPFMLWCVLVLGAPPSVLGGVVQDVAFAGWTAWALLQTDGDDSNGHTKGASSSSSSSWRLFRLALAACGLAEIYVGGRMMFDPEGYIDGVSPWFALFDDPASATVAPIHLGIRSIGLMCLLIGGYQATVARLGAADRRVYWACACYHSVFCLATIGFCRAHGLRAPLFHAAAGILLATIGLWSEQEHS